LQRYLLILEYKQKFIKHLTCRFLGTMRNVQISSDRTSLISQNQNKRKDQHKKCTKGTHIHTRLSPFLAPSTKKNKTIYIYASFNTFSHSYIDMRGGIKEMWSKKEKKQMKKGIKAAHVDVNHGLWTWQSVGVWATFNDWIGVDTFTKNAYKSWTVKDTGLRLV
jgi:hypothetical protein